MGGQEWPVRQFLSEQPVHWDSAIELAGSSGGGLIAKEETVVDYAGEDTAEERAHPVDAMIRPVTSNESRSESTGGIHGGASEGVADEDADGDGETDWQAGEPIREAPAVHHRGKKNEDKYERENRFEDHGVHTGEVRDGGEVGSAERNRAPDGFGYDGDEQKSSSERAEKLSDPVKECFHRAQTAGNPEAGGDSGIEMSAGYVPNGAHHYSHGESTSQGNCEQADVRLAVGAEILIGANATRTGENQRKTSGEFDEELLAEAVHGYSAIGAG
jgi:hypothetical protein